MTIAASPSFAAGGGAGSGGATFQRAINSGLPPGEAGPAGAPNNPRQPGRRSKTSGVKGSPRSEGSTGR